MTASAHLRNSWYRPPARESSSFSISACDRFSRLPRGPMRASTKSGMTILVSKAIPSIHLGPYGTGKCTRRGGTEALRLDVDRNVVRRHHPDFHHVRVGDGDATIRPVLSGVVVRGMARIVRHAVDHDGTAGLPAIAAGAAQILVVGIRDLDRQEEIAARV